MPEIKLNLCTVKKKKWKGYFIMTINFFLIYLLISILFLQEKTNVLANEIPKEIVDPEEVSGLVIDTEEGALAEANSQLIYMDVGNILTINNSNNFHALLIRDYEMGDIYYWELVDDNVAIKINGMTCEIISYSREIYNEGTFQKSEIESLSNIIAQQFAVLPNDKQGPNAEFITNATIKIIEYEEFNDTIVYDYWNVQYIRIYDNIESEDTIWMTLSPNGDLVGYNKIWNMNLSNLNTYYAIDRTQAESTALQACEQGSYIVLSKKMIVRPNNAWYGSLQYGATPCCVWEIHVRDTDNNRVIFHIDKVQNTIIGSDIYSAYYDD